MGFFDKVLGSKNKATIKGFVFGIERIKEASDSSGLVVYGRVIGSVSTGMAGYLHSWRDDEQKTILTTVSHIEIDGKKASKATECCASLTLENVSKKDVFVGTVFASQNASSNDVHLAYATAVDREFVSYRDLEFTDAELKELSMTDMAESMHLYSWKVSNLQRLVTNPNEQRNVVKQINNKLGKLSKALGEKILEQDEIYVVMSKVTNEPFMFSDTIDNKNGTYTTTPPEIMLVTKPYAPIYKDVYDKMGCEIKTVTKDEDGQGILKFLSRAFHLNGACGVRVIYNVGVAGDKLVPPPNFDGLPEIEIPVTNPGLMRWLLLMNQSGAPKTKEAETIYKMKYNFFLQELAKAKLLVPMRVDNQPEPTGKPNQAVFTKDTQMQIATLPGKAERSAVRMYTDWSRLREVFDDEWSSMITPVSGMIEVMDCAINVTSNPNVGVYINKQTYDDAVALSEKVAKRQQSAQADKSEQDPSSEK